MTLVIAAQDIRSISLGIVADGALAKQVEVSGEPDRYLAALHETLAAWNIKIDDITQVTVVAGPGAFTASRVSITLANAIAFVRKIPLVAVSNPARLTLEQLIVSPEFSSATPLNGFAVPVYDRPPHITLPKGKPLAASH